MRETPDALLDQIEYEQTKAQWDQESSRLIGLLGGVWWWIAAPSVVWSFMLKIAIVGAEIATANWGESDTRTPLPYEIVVEEAVV